MNNRSLRKIKREATAQALADAAFELALERGMDGFVVDDVVRNAGYSRRTFANHFSCKEEAVATAAISINGTHEEEAWNLLADMPEDTPLLDVLYRMLRTQLTARLISNMRKIVSLSQTYPSLEPYILKVFRRLQNEAQESLSELTPTVYPEGYVHLLLGAVYGAMLPVVDGSLNVLLPGQDIEEAPGATPFEQYLETIFGYLRNGF